MGKKLKGLAKIELINAETGEVRTQYEHNMVTNAIPNLYAKNPYAACHVSRSPSYLMGGLMLFNEQLEENVNNTMIPRTPDAWAGNGISKGLSTKRGNAVLQETKVTPTGCKLVWEFGTAQGNGTYQSLALTHPIISSHDIFGYAADHDEQDKAYCDIPFTGETSGRNGGIGIEGDGSTITEEMANAWNPDYIDVENGYFYRLRYDYATPNTLRIWRASRKTYSIPIYQCNFANSTAVDNNARDSLFYNDPIELSVTLENALPIKNSGRVSSIHVHNGIMYIFSFATGTNSILQTAIDLSTFTANGVTVTQKTLTYNDVSYYIYRYNSAGFFSSLGPNKVAFKYPYIYVPTNADKTVFYRLNIEDTTDIITLSGNAGAVETAATASSVNGPNMALNFGNFIVRPGWYIIDTVSNTITPGPNKNAFRANLASFDPDYSFIKIDEEHYMYKIYLSVGSNNVYGHNNASLQVIAMNPFYLATINNVTPFTKTSADVMRITYTITEADA
jgi:hypothetical protein